MTPYLQAVFHGQPIGTDLCARIKVLGFGGIRADLQRTPAARAKQVIAEATAAGLAVLAIVDDGLQIYQLGACEGVLAFELRNEPDLELKGAEAYYMALAEHAAVAAAAVNRPLYVGGVSNIDAKPLRYLRRVLEAVAPWPEVRVSVHRYPHTLRASDARPGYRSREAEVDAFRWLIGTRQWAVTEFGYHTAPWSDGWWLWKRTYQRNDLEVRDAVMWEWAFWQRMGADLAVLYQLNDGPTGVALDRYGIRRTDGTWKPAAYTVA